MVTELWKGSSFYGDCTACIFYKVLEILPVNGKTFSQSMQWFWHLINKRGYNNKLQLPLPKHATKFH